MSSLLFCLHGPVTALYFKDLEFGDHLGGVLRVGNFRT